MRSIHALPISLVVAGLLMVSSTASARSYRVSEMPNGSKFGCNSCHSSYGFTDFGRHVGQTLSGRGDVNWQAVYAADDDGDGYTNGEEFGDPNGLWQIGDPNPSTPAFNPGDPRSNPCGDALIEGPEECDGAELGGATCASVGEGTGTLRCTSQCHFDIAGCQADTSGNTNTNGSNTSNTSNTGTTTNTGNTGNTDPGTGTVDPAGGVDSGPSNAGNANPNGSREPTIIVLTDDQSSDNACSVTGLGGPSKTSPVLIVIGLLALDGLMEAHKRRM